MLMMKLEVGLYEKISFFLYEKFKATMNDVLSCGNTVHKEIRDYDDVVEK
jgi:hypothetical protein